MTWAAEGVRGEVTIVVAGRRPPPRSAETDPTRLRAAVAEREADGLTRKEAIVEVARLAGVPKREVYDLVHRSMSARIASYAATTGWSSTSATTGPLDGDPVVLLHGFPERAETWREVAPLLHEAGLRTFAPDQRGYSPGRPPAAAPRLPHRTCSSPTSSR